MNLRNLKLWAVAILLILILVFMLQNLQAVQITFLFWSIGTSLALLMFVIFLVGLLLGWFGTMMLQRRRRRGRQ